MMALEKAAYGPEIAAVITDRLPVGKLLVQPGAGQVGGNQSNPPRGGIWLIVGNWRFKSTCELERGDEDDGTRKSSLRA